MTFSVYSKSGCPYCVKVEQVLKLAEVKYVIYKLDTDYTREQFYNEFGVGSTFPQVKCDSNIIGGCQETVKFLREQNLV